MPVIPLGGIPTGTVGVPPYDMAARFPTPANGTEPSVLPFRSLAQSPVAVENESTAQRDTAGSICIQEAKGQDSAVKQVDAGSSTWTQTPKSLIRPHTQAPSTGEKQLTSSNIPEHLALFIIDMVPNSYGHELGDAFQNAADVPPITNSSLTELDIMSMWVNIKLRHDCNFDRDLSFRPNLDGNKGLDKMKAARKFWKALEAELVLYSHLFPRSQSILHFDVWSKILDHAQRRIPKTFETIKTILKTLVPDRDHARIDEQLDIDMLMDRIRRGMCDLVRLSQWFACLLKEHCAPMRDEWVDRMVESTKLGVAEDKPEYIVSGLRELLGILEAMKLDVANHQIRHLKPGLIDETVNFERSYHLVNVQGSHRRLNHAAAHRWYTAELERYTQLTTPRQKNTSKVGTAVLVRGIARILFSNDNRCDFPDTFYLDYDRLRTLRSEIDYNIYFEICFDLFGQLSNDFGFSGIIPSTSKQALRTSLAAIMGDYCSSSPSPWWMNSEHISAELIRQALILSNRTPKYNSRILEDTNRTLRAMYETSYEKHSNILKKLVTEQTLPSIQRNLSSSPMDLYNTFVSVSSSSSSRLSPVANPSGAGELTPSPQPDHVTNFSNRLAHILILHWRVWGDMVYLTEEESSSDEITVGANILSNTTSPTTHAPTTTGEVGSEPTVVVLLNTVEPPDKGEQGTLENAVIE